MILTRDLRRKWCRRRCSRYFTKEMEAEADLPRDLRQQWCQRRLNPYFTKEMGPTRKLNPKPLKPVIYDGDGTRPTLARDLRGKLARNPFDGGNPVLARDLRRKWNQTHLSQRFTREVGPNPP